jgi:hypothetical protein
VNTTAAATATDVLHIVFLKVGNVLRQTVLALLKRKHLSVLSSFAAAPSSCNSSSCLQQNLPACLWRRLAALLLTGNAPISSCLFCHCQPKLLSYPGGGGAAAAAAAAADCPISVQDEAQLKLYYQVKLKAICEQLKVPSKVLVRT